MDPTPSTAESQPITPNDLRDNQIRQRWLNRERKQANPVIDCPAMLRRTHDAPDGMLAAAMISEWAIGLAKHETYTGVKLERDRAAEYCKRLDGRITDLLINWETTPCHPAKFATDEDRDFDASALGALIDIARTYITDIRIHVYGPRFYHDPAYPSRIDSAQHYQRYAKHQAIGDTLLINGYIRHPIYLEDIDAYEEHLLAQAERLIETTGIQSNRIAVITSPITRFEHTHDWRTTLFDIDGRRVQQEHTRLIARHGWTHLNWYEAEHMASAKNFPLVI